MSDLTGTIEIKVLLCQFCDAPCMSEAELKLHISSKHEKDNFTTAPPEPSTSRNSDNKKPYKCQKCNKKYEHQEKLEAHKKSNCFSFECSMCRKTCTSKKIWKKHNNKEHRGKAEFKMKQNLEESSTDEGETEEIIVVD